MKATAFRTSPGHGHKDLTLRRKAGRCRADARHWSVNIGTQPSPTLELQQSHVTDPLCWWCPHSLTCPLQPAVVGLHSAFQQRRCTYLLKATHSLLFLPIFPLLAAHLHHKPLSMCSNGETSHSSLGQVCRVSSGMALPFV